MNFIEFKSKFERFPVQEYPNKVLTNPLVTVCIQTYNHENYIKSCIESILEQKTNFNYEIIISEDESDDKTRDICIQYAIKYPEKIKLFLNSRKNNIKVDGNSTGNFTALYNLYSAKGKYIAFCEGDDYWNDPLKLQLQFDFMEANPLYSICYHNYNIVNTSGQLIKSDKANPLKIDLKVEELQYPFIHPATLTIFFHNTFREFPEAMTEVITLDVFLYTLLGLKGPGKYLQYIAPSSYRVHDKGLWSNRRLEDKLIAKINTYNKINKYYLTEGKKENTVNFRKRIFKLQYYLLYLSIKKIQPITFFQHFLNLLKLKP
jgi:glycosyltransferase involved in cell wall biosynthesis